MLNRTHNCKINFSFLFGKKLYSLKSSEIEKHVKDLCMKYDFVPAQFILEAQVLKSTILPFFESNVKFEKIIPLKVLNVLHKTGMVDSFSNVDIALRIFLTMPVSVASNERAFSKLKLLKTYLRSCMGQERLTNLAILSVEHEITKLTDFDKIIAKFAEEKLEK